MTCRDDGRVVFVVKGGAAEVDEPHRGVVYSPLVALLRGDRGGHGNVSKFDLTERIITV